MSVTYEITEEIAAQLLGAESNCFSESLQGLPEDLIQLLRDQFPQVCDSFGYMWRDYPCNDF